MTPRTQPEDVRRAVERTVRDFLAGPDNRLAPEDPDQAGVPAFDPAPELADVLGFVAGDDPLWDFYTGHIGPGHWTPARALELDTGTAADPAAITVASWVLPQTPATRRAHRREREHPSDAWSYARLNGERANEALRRRVVEALGGIGVAACAPALLPQWRRWGEDPAHVFASAWSERHAAFAAGLGTFSLSDGLITRRGKAVRVGSVVLAATVPATPRRYTDPFEHCLRSAGVECTACMRRCPAGAITPEGHDKRACHAYIRGTTAPHVEQRLGTRVNSCGLCQVGVPCEARIPKRPKA